MSSLTKDSTVTEYFTYILSPAQISKIVESEKILVKYVKNVFRRKKVEKFIVDKKNLIRQMYFRTNEKIPEPEKIRIIQQVVVKETNLNISFEKLKEYLEKEKIGLNGNQLY